LNFIRAITGVAMAENHNQVQLSNDPYYIKGLFDSISSAHAFCFPLKHLEQSTEYFKETRKDYKKEIENLLTFLSIKTDKHDFFQLKRKHSLATKIRNDLKGAAPKEVSNFILMIRLMIESLLRKEYEATRPDFSPTMYLLEEPKTPNNKKGTIKFIEKSFTIIINGEVFSGFTPHQFYIIKYLKENPYTPQWYVIRDIEGIISEKYPQRKNLNYDTIRKYFKGRKQHKFYRDYDYIVSDKANYSLNY
jgi:hypothetical protein